MSIQFGATITLPANVYGVSERTYRRAVTDALRKAAADHGRARLPKHFQAGAHTKYGYRERNARYNASKRKFRGFAVDLRLTDRSYRFMKDPANQRIRISGASGARGTPGQLVILETRFPFPGGSNREAVNRNRGGVTIQDMVSEVSRFTSAEVDEVGREVAAHFEQTMRRMPRASRRYDIGQAMLALFPEGT